MDPVCAPLATRWPLPELSLMESFLVCPICEDFFHTAMVFPKCNHVFCSACIRRSLQYGSVCPCCKTAVEVSELRNERVLDELTNSWRRVRNSLHERLTTTAAASHQAPASSSPRSPQASPHSPAVSRTRKRRRLRNVCDDDDEEEDGLQASPAPKQTANTPRKLNSTRSLSPSRTASNAPCVGASQSTSTASPVTQPEQQSAAKDDQDDDDDIIVLDDTASEEKSTSSQPRRSSRRLATQKQKQTDAANGKVSCPACGLLVFASYINTHLDECISTEQGREHFFCKHKQKKPPEPPTDNRYPAKLSWSVMSDKQLRKFLSDHCLPSNGDRATLRRRAREYTVLRDAENDSLSPRSDQQLASEVMQMEEPGAPSGAMGRLLGKGGRRKQDRDAGQVVGQSDSSFAAMAKQLKEQQRARKLERDRQRAEAARSETPSTNSSSESAAQSDSQTVPEAPPPSGSTEPPPSVQPTVPAPPAPPSPHRPPLGAPTPNSHLSVLSPSLSLASASSSSTTTSPFPSSFPLPPMSAPSPASPSHLLQPPIVIPPCTPISTHTPDQPSSQTGCSQSPSLSLPIPPDHAAHSGPPSPVY